MTSLREQMGNKGYAEFLKSLRPEDQAAFRALERQIDTAGFENVHPALHRWIDRENSMVKHPFVYAFVGPEFLLADEVSRMYEWKRKHRQRTLAEKDWVNYIFGIERPWRLHRLRTLWERRQITKRELRKLLSIFWMDTECPQGNQSDPMFLFLEANFVTDAPKEWKAIPDNFTLYRGVDGELELTADGPSWTMEKGTALFFAKRYLAGGYVVKYEATKDEALAYFAGRGETEIILDFFNRSDPAGIEVVKRFGDTEVIFNYREDRP